MFNYKLTRFKLVTFYLYLMLRAQISFAMHLSSFPFSLLSFLQEKRSVLLLAVGPVAIVVRSATGESLGSTR